MVITFARPMPVERGDILRINDKNHRVTEVISLVQVRVDRPWWIPLHDLWYWLPFHRCPRAIKWWWLAVWSSDQD